MPCNCSGAKSSGASFAGRSASAGGSSASHGSAPCGNKQAGGLIGCSDPWAKGPNLVALLACDGRFNVLLELLKLANLLDTVVSNDTQTIFAPTDEAFAKLPQAVLDKLIVDGVAQPLLAQVLLYHLLPRAKSAALLTRAPPTDEATLANNENVMPPVPYLLQIDLALNADASTRVVVKSNAGQPANIIEADVDGCNGVAHYIDQVLLPLDPC